MLQTIITIFYALLALLLIAIVLIQRGKNSMGVGSMGGSSQMLFGASGGQDFLQKTTWVLGALLMGGCLLLSLMQQTSSERYAHSAPTSIPFSQQAD